MPTKTPPALDDFEVVLELDEPDRDDVLSLPCSNVLDHELRNALARLEARRVGANEFQPELGFFEAEEGARLGAAS